MDLQKTIKSFEKKGYVVHSFETAAEAADYLVETVKDTTVGIGGSQTVKDMGIYERLCESNKVYWHWIENTMEVRKQANSANVYLVSANGVSENGEIVNIDGLGNRIAATAFEAEHLIYIIGTNKIVPTLEDAIWRARNVAAPPNAKRLNRKTPCAVKGDKCYDCASPDRICKVMSVNMHKPDAVKKAEIIIINQSLGF